MLLLLYPLFLFPSKRNEEQSKNCFVFKQIHVPLENRIVFRMKLKIKLQILMYNNTTPNSNFMVNCSCFIESCLFWYKLVIYFYFVQGYLPVATHAKWHVLLHSSCHLASRVSPAAHSAARPTWSQIIYAGTFSGHLISFEKNVNALPINLTNYYQQEHFLFRRSLKTQARKMLQES